MSFNLRDIDMALHRRVLTAQSSIIKEPMASSLGLRSKGRPPPRRTLSNASTEMANSPYNDRRAVANDVDDFISLK
jgi:hypothetical protein